jgi:TolA-binding protein
VIPFAPKNAASDNADQLDNAGQTILKLLHKAADVAEANSKHALDMAQKLSHQLRSAEDRIAELEAEVQLYQEKCERAERWLHKVYTEIEDRVPAPAGSLLTSTSRQAHPASTPPATSHVGPIRTRVRTSASSIGLSQSVKDKPLRSIC